MKLINQTKSFATNEAAVITDAVEFIEDTLKSKEVNRKLIIRAMLLSEEIIAQLRDTASVDNIKISVKRLFGDTEILIRAKGDELNPYASNVEGIDNLEDLGDEDSQMAIRALLLKSQGEQLKFSYKNGINQIRILVGQAEKSMLMRTVVALGLGLILGFLLKEVVSESATKVVCNYVLTPIKTIFLNSLKIIIAPVVFFSIVSCFSQFNNIKELGRIGAKIMAMYTMTTTIAVVIAMGITSLLQPGTFGFAKELVFDEINVKVEEQVATSLLDTIVNIVPNNFLKPFLESNTLQIIFLAVLCGLAVGMIGDYSKMLQDFFEACCSLFLTITSIIAQFIPIAVFCSIALIVNSVSADTFYSLLSMIGVYLLTVCGMLCVYGLLVFIIGRLNPFIFYKNDRESMITSFSLSSSNAAMPTNIRTCIDKMGVALTIILLSLGAPGVPGGSMVCLGVVLPTLGVPIEAIGLILAIYPFMDMFNTMLNTTGDVAAAVIVAKTEGAVDTEKYYSKNE